MPERTPPPAGVLRWQDPVTEEILRFRPVESSQGWAVMAEEVRRIITEAGPASWEQARELMRAMTRLAVFAHNDGYPPEAPVLLAKELIERFLEVGCGGVPPATRTRLKNQLLALRNVVLQGDGRRNPELKLWAASRWRPYTAAQLIDLWSWARGQRTERLRRGCRTLLCLGYGCGLPSPAIVHVHTDDVHRSTDRDPLTITGHHEFPRPPAVCLRSWEDFLLKEVSHIPEPGGHLFQPRRHKRTAGLVSELLAQTDPAPDTPSLQMSRLHATWFVSMVDAGVPLTVIIAQTGLRGFKTLYRVLPYLAGADAAQAEELLRDPAPQIPEPPQVPRARAADSDGVIELFPRTGTDKRGD